MRPAPLDELPVHQAPVSMAHVATTDKNFYDRYYFNAHARDDQQFLVVGHGIYPNLGVIDAFATLRMGDRQWAVRFSDAHHTGELRTEVGGFRVEVLEPLQRLRVICEHPTLSFDLTWEGAFPAVLEDRHMLVTPPRTLLDATRFAQVGSWSGTLSCDGTDLTVDPDTWMGSRDRSWGIRPVGEPDPQGRLADEPNEGHWWLYMPLWFDDHMLLVIVQERPDGHRNLSHATRVGADGRIEQLGWPQIDIDYRSSTRTPVAARIGLTTPKGEALTVEVETLTSVSLNVGAGYDGESEWQHGKWMGRDWSSQSTYDLTDPELTAKLPFATVDHVARAECDGQVGHGMFEHAVIGRHDPSGFEGYLDLAP